LWRSKKKMISTMRSSTYSQSSSQNVHRDVDYFTEVGIKFSQFKFSVRIPSLSVGTKDTVEDKDWKWIPQRSTSTSSSTTTSIESVSWNPEGSVESDSAAPPVPPRSLTMTLPPPSALPPYSSSTVSRRWQQHLRDTSSRHFSSYVWKWCPASRNFFCAFVWQK